MLHPEEAEDEAWIYNGKEKVPPTVRRVKIAENLTKIRDSAFQSHLELEEVILSSSILAIGKRAFLCCTKLKSILYQGREKEEVGIPSTVKVIDDQAFWRCILLENLVLNEGLERIGEHAFSHCYSLSHVRISQSVNSIATTAFSICSDLISIELPDECSFEINLSGCRSLVSLAGPISIVFQEDEDWEEFFQSSKLGSLVDKKADLERKLKHRFDNSPLNKLCYYQSYHSYEDAMARLRSSLMDENSLAATTKVDEFGMTPLHILSLSQTPNVDMLLAVMQAGRLDHIIFCKDSFGSTPMDYLCLNLMPTSTEVMRRVLETRFAQLLGLDVSLKSEMLQAVDWPSRRREVVAIYLKLAKYEERQETLCLLELHLWKTKIDEVTAQEETVDRDFCRVNSGASIVLRHVQPFLDEPDVEAYFVSYPDQFDKKKKTTNQ
eukprot:scaffold101_cov123-Cylindrotheca_fusiformis.AAC.4